MNRVGTPQGPSPLCSFDLSLVELSFARWPTCADASVSGRCRVLMPVCPWKAPVAEELERVAGAGRRCLCARRRRSRRGHARQGDPGTNPSRRPGLARLLRCCTYEHRGSAESNTVRRPPFLDPRATQSWLCVRHLSPPPRQSPAAQVQPIGVCLGLLLRRHVCVCVKTLVQHEPHHVITSSRHHRVKAQTCLAQDDPASAPLARCRPTGECPA